MAATAVPINRMMATGSSSAMGAASLHNTYAGIEGSSVLSSAMMSSHPNITWMGHAGPGPGAPLAAGPSAVAAAGGAGVTLRMGSRMQSATPQSSAATIAASALYGPLGPTAGSPAAVAAVAAAGALGAGSAPGSAGGAGPSRLRLAAPLPGFGATAGGQQHVTSPPGRSPMTSGSASARQSMGQLTAHAPPGHAHTAAQLETCEGLDAILASYESMASISAGQGPGLMGGRAHRAASSRLRTAARISVDLARRGSLELPKALAAVVPGLGVGGLPHIGLPTMQEERVSGE